MPVAPEADEISSDGAARSSPSCTPLLVRGRVGEVGALGEEQARRGHPRSARADRQTRRREDVGVGAGRSDGLSVHQGQHEVDLLAVAPHPEVGRLRPPEVARRALVHALDLAAVVGGGQPVPLDLRSGQGGDHLLHRGTSAAAHDERSGEREQQPAPCVHDRVSPVDPLMLLT